ncbi:hypothetical protein [Specibacter sp. NPDC078709]|uniref:hypothetical protein n=1 Tax=Specibacter sp. NPDC078709 TaxID=3154364 RepID=UPI00342D3622
MNTRQRHAKQEAACLALRAAAVMVAALLVSGCSSSSQQTSPPPQTYLPEPATLQDAVDCSTSTGWEPAATTPAALLKGRVPDGFIPVDVVRCSIDSATTDVTEDHLSGDYTPLLAALAVPSERGGPMSCLDYGEILPGIWLINAAGQAVNVQWPMDSCDHSKPDTASALAMLTVVSSAPVPKEGTSITP